MICEDKFDLVFFKGRTSSQFTEMRRTTFCHLNYPRSPRLERVLLVRKVVMWLVNNQPNGLKYCVLHSFAIPQMEYTKI